MSNDDIAFQRAILENPSDTTLKLVYADGCVLRVSQSETE